MRKLRISDMGEVIGALSSGTHPNRIAQLLTYPVLPPIPLGHYLNSIDVVMFPLSTPRCMCGHPNCYYCA